MEFFLCCGMELLRDAEPTTTSATLRVLVEQKDSATAPAVRLTKTRKPEDRKISLPHPKALWLFARLDVAAETSPTWPKRKCVCVRGATTDGCSATANDLPYRIDLVATLWKDCLGAEDLGREAVLETDSLSTRAFSEMTT
jgi:hypothetical protein